MIGVQSPADNLFQNSGVQPDACAPGTALYLDTLPVRDLQFGTACWTSHAMVLCNLRTRANAIANQMTYGAVHPKIGRMSRILALRTAKPGVPARPRTVPFGTPLRPIGAREFTFEWLHSAVGHGKPSSSGRSGRLGARCRWFASPAGIAFWVEDTCLLS